MSADIDELLPDAAVNLDIAAKDWRDAIRLAGDALREAGSVSYTHLTLPTTPYV